MAPRRSKTANPGYSQDTDSQKSELFLAFWQHRSETGRATVAHSSPQCVHYIETTLRFLHFWNAHLHKEEICTKAV